MSFGHISPVNLKELYWLYVSENYSSAKAPIWRLFRLSPAELERSC